MTTGYGAMVFARGNSFFASLAQQYARTSVVVCEEAKEVLGMGVLAHIPAALFGSPLQSIGYFTQLRSKRSARGLTFLARAYRFMRTECDRSELPLYITSILEENKSARKILESGRAGLPSYVPIASLVTVLLRSSGVARFVSETAGVEQQFSLTTSSGVPHAWDQRGFRSILLRHPTPVARLTAALLFRSLAPLHMNEIDVPVRYLTNWEQTPNGFFGQSGVLHALTLDVRDERYKHALRYSAHTTHSILYGVSWNESPTLARLTASSAPVYVDAGLL